MRRQQEHGLSAEEARSRFSGTVLGLLYLRGVISRDELLAGYEYHRRHLVYLDAIDAPRAGGTANRHTDLTGLDARGRENAFLRIARRVPQSGLDALSAACYANEIKDLTVLVQALRIVVGSVELTRAARRFSVCEIDDGSSAP